MEHDLDQVARDSLRISELEALLEQEGLRCDKAEDALEAASSAADHLRELASNPRAVTPSELRAIANSLDPVVTDEDTRLWWGR